MKRTISQFVKSNQGQPLFMIKAVKHKYSLEEYSNLENDNYEVWEYETLPIDKEKYENITKLTQLLNPDGRYPLRPKEAKRSLLLSVIEYLSRSKGERTFFTHGVAHHN